MLYQSNSARVRRITGGGTFLTEYPGSFTATNANIPIQPMTHYTLAFRLSPTAQVGQYVGLSLQANNAFFGFKDGDGTDAYVNSIAGPARTSGLTTVSDKPDTLQLIAGSPRDISTPAVPQNTNSPFLEFSLKASADQVKWATLQLTKMGTADDATISATVWADGGVAGWSGDETPIGSVNRFNDGKATASITRTATPAVVKYFVTLNANASAVGTVGVQVSSSPVAFGVGGTLDTFQATPYDTFTSALQTIVSHDVNTLNVVFTDKAVDGQTVDQGARVVLGQAELSTNLFWTDLTQWEVALKGTAGSNDIAAHRSVGRCECGRVRQ